MRLSKNRLQWIGGGVLVAALLVGGGIYVAGPTYFFLLEGPSSDGEEGGSEQAVKLVSHEGIAGESGPAEVKGVVRNTSKRRHGHVKVEVRFFDGTGSQVGDTTAHTSGLEPGQEWGFEVPVVGDSVTRYEIDRVTWQ